MKRTDKLAVYVADGAEKRLVGSLALYQNRFAAFAYSDSWLSDGFSLSPFSLPLQKKVFVPDWEPFGGIHGIFNDSLPDGWGRLLVDRMLLKNGIQPETLSVLDRLAIVGSGGMGALTYEPEHVLTDAPELPADYDALAAECKALFQAGITGSVQSPQSDLDAVFAAGGSSGGARPKLFSRIGGEDWIIKFPSSQDPAEIGLQEYEYSQCAQRCGIAVSEARLFPSRQCAGYFGTKRFDRTGTGGRIHMASASALLETSHRIPNLDYNTLLLLTLQLTKSAAEVEKLFRLMCFNVFAHNRDDHSKNFTWLYDERTGSWRLSPAYDLTYSNSIGGEHATTVDGEGRAPTIAHILAVAEKNGINKATARRIAEEVQTAVHEMLGKWLCAR